MVAVLAWQSPLAAQDALEAQTGEPPERIDIRIDTAPDPIVETECEDEQDAAQLTGEIVVCGTRTGNENRLYDRETAQRRHAERTKGPQPVDVAGPGIFRGKPTISGMCFIPPCPKEPAYMIDFSSLPDTPPGSDADRIARGLAPRGQDRGVDGRVTIAGTPVASGATGQTLQADAEELGLPPPAVRNTTNPSKSASPEVEPQG